MELDLVRIGDALPPRTKRPNQFGGKWYAALQHLVDDPGVWYKIAYSDNPRSAYTLSSNLNRRSVNFPQSDGEFSFVARRQDEGCAVYGRYDAR